MSRQGGPRRRTAATARSKGSARKPARPYHHGDLRAVAVRLAVEHVHAHGDLPSLRALAEACGVTHAALYRHFDDVEALRRAIAAVAFRAMTADIEQAIAAHHEPYARLAAGNRAAIHYAVAHRALYGLALGPELANQQHHTEFFEAARGMFATLVGAVAGCGVAEPLPVAHTVLAAVHGLADLLRNGRTIPGPARDLEGQIDALNAMVCAWVRTQAMPARPPPGGATRAAP